MILILCAALPYINTLANAFVFDDHNQIEFNPYLQNFRHLKEIFSTNVWSFEGAYGVTNYYRPMMTLGFLLCYQLFGPLPYGFHLANVLVHSAVVLILYAASRRLFEDRWPAFLAAVAFALHPVHTESVDWVSGVTDLEVTFFMLLAFWFYLGVGRARGRKAVGLGLGMAASFILALFSKEQAMALPVLAAIYEHFYRRDRAETPAGQKISRYAGLWLIGAGYLLFRARFFGALAPVQQRPGISKAETLFSGVALFGQYLGKLVWPAKLCMFYVFQKSETWRDPAVLAGAAALVAFLALFRALWSRRGPASFAMIWLLLTLAPVLNAHWMAANVFAERYLYLPSVGFSWLLASAVAEAWARTQIRGQRRRTAAAALAGCLLVAGLARIVLRNRDWRTDQVLYAKTLEQQPDAYLIHINLGAVNWADGDVAGAEREWKEALRLAPDHPIALNDMGLLYTRQKRYAEAVEYFEKAIQVKPNFTDAHMFLGACYRDMGKNGLAEKEFRAAVNISPLNVRARNYLGKLYLSEGRIAEAEEQYRRSLESAENLEAWDALGDILLDRHDSDRAVRAYLRAVAIEPYDSHAHFRLGALYRSAGRSAEASAEYQKGLETDPTNAEALAAVKELKAQSGSHGP
jgi:protein O-mannosyl-transferase